MFSFIARGKNKRRVGNLLCHEKLDVLWIVISKKKKKKIKLEVLGVFNPV